MSIITTTSQNMSLKDIVRENFIKQPAAILKPTITGIAGFIGTVLLLTTNPLGWTISGTILIGGIIMAALSAIGSIGYSVYLLLQKPQQVNNLVTKQPPAAPVAPLVTPPVTPEANPVISATPPLGGTYLIPPTTIHPTPLPDKSVEPTPVSPPAEKAKTMKDYPYGRRFFPLQKPNSPPPPSHDEASRPYLEEGAPIPSRVPFQPAPPRREKPRSLSQKVKNYLSKHPIKSAFIAGAALLGGYALYSIPAAAKVIPLAANQCPIPKNPFSVLTPLERPISFWQKLPRIGRVIKGILTGLALLKLRSASLI